MSRFMEHMFYRLDKSMATLRLVNNSLDFLEKILWQRTVEVYMQGTNNSPGQLLRKIQLAVLPIHKKEEISFSAELTPLTDFKK